MQLPPKIKGYRSGVINLIIDNLAALRNIPSPDVTPIETPQGTWYKVKRQAGGGAGVDFSQFAFGFSVSGAVVTVTTGKVRHGTRTPIAVASADITIATDHAWLYVRYPLGTGAATIEQSTTEPVSTEEIINWPLTQWRLQGGAASVELPVCHVGDINITGAFA